ncbi:MAG TPA: hypothetical protein VK590_02275 [Saprospiraceae bacterium]|nr:hypothetical protein [Saprospiraceae bacterium]
MIWLYRIGFAINLFTLGFIIYQYIILPLFQEFVSTRWNATLALCTILLCVIMCIAYYLNNYQNNLKLALVLVWIPALPTLLYLLLLAALVIGKPDWK